MTHQVSLSDSAYAKLRQAKRTGESFSDTVERLLAATRKEPARFPERLGRLRWDLTPEEQLAIVEKERDATRQVP